jgi:hypothetical protein
VAEIGFTDLFFECLRLFIDSKLKSGKSNEPDLKLNEFMKNSVANMVLVIVKLFNKILQLGKFPKLKYITYFLHFQIGYPD